MYRHRSKKVRLFGVGLVAIIWLAFAGLNGLREQEDGENGEASYQGRHLLELHAGHLPAGSVENTTDSGLHNESHGHGHENCTPRSIHQFPPDIFDHSQRKHGGVLVHVAITLYIFVAVAIICDDYFVPSLEKLCEALNLQADVAGATFMAAGSSAPELFTSIIGLFFAHSDVGVGTIVGSAVFNILFIVAICGLGAGMVIYLTWWSMMRDSSYYMLSVIVLIIIISDSTIHWYEATVMLILYVLYIVLMFFNEKLGGWATRTVSNCQKKRKAKKAKKAIDKEQGEALNTMEANGTEPIKHKAVNDLIRKPRSDSVRSEYSMKSNRSMAAGGGGGSAGGGGGSEEVTYRVRSDSMRSDYSTQSVRALKLAIEAEAEEEYTSPLTIPDGILKKVFWFITLPVNLVYMITVPDVRRPGCWQKLWAIAFMNSILWIAILSYFMVWMVTIIGDVLGIPDTVMGLTFLAAGTSVPDALASLFVARDGFGDMAVSNSIGSNVFDILLCLGLPWLIQTAMVDPGSTVVINSDGLTMCAVTLLGTVIFLVAAVSLNKWRLDKRLGVICLIVYAIFIVLSCLYELNVFGYMNPPACPRTQ